MYIIYFIYYKIIIYFVFIVQIIILEFYRNIYKLILHKLIKYL